MVDLNGPDGAEAGEDAAPDPGESVVAQVNGQQAGKLPEGAALQVGQVVVVEEDLSEFGKNGQCRVCYKKTSLIESD